MTVPRDTVLRSDFEGMRLARDQALDRCARQTETIDTLVHELHAAKKSPVKNHVWVRSQLGHGEAMCAFCQITNREAAILGKLNVCEAA